MEIINDYLNNVFAGLPNTEQVKHMKQNMADSMEEKCQELVAEGKTEHEAAYSVIANFGSMDEIVAELGITREEEAQSTGRFIPHDQIEAYLARTRKDGMWIGSGVGIILFGVAVLILLGGNSLGLFVLFGAITFAVGIFFARGIPMSACEINAEQVISLEGHTKAELELRRREYIPVFTVQLVAGVMSILLSIGAVAVFFVTPALILFAVGIATYLFITGGVTKGTYDTLLAKAKSSMAGDVERRRKSERLIGAIAAAFWPLVTAGYLGWSFGWNAWDISWVVWPVAGCVFGAIAGGIGAWGHSDGNGR